MNKMKQFFRVIGTFLKKYLHGFTFLLMPLLTLAMMEVLRAPYIKGFFEEGIENAVIKYTLSYLVILSIQYMFSKILFSKIAGVCITNIILFVFAFASCVMIIITGDPLLPAHMFQAKNVGEIVGFIDIPWKSHLKIATIILSVLILFYIAICIFFSTKKKQSVKGRIFSTVFSVLFCMFLLNALTVNVWVKENVFPKIKMQVSGYYTISDYKKNGFLLTFLSHFADLVVEEPEYYSEENIDAIIEQYPEISENFENQPWINAENINVIAIQSESLWDPTRMENIKLSGDPLKYMRSLSRYGEMGILTSPSFGCNTCVPEFEYISGFSSYFLKAGAYPYSQYVHSEIPTLPSCYKENGYVTYALHTYDKYFYGRNSAYKLMGFDKFVGKSDLEDPEIKGVYVSDDEVTRQIIKMYEEKGDAPMFLYAITMQNHGNYLEQRYTEYDIDVQSDVLDAGELSGLRDAVQGVHDADKALFDLAEYFKKQEEPTIIVIYGDHLPFLGLNSSTYYDTQFLKTDNLGENPAIYETPYLVWSNFGLDFELPERLSPAHLGVETVKLSGLEKTYWHHRFFEKFFNNFSVVQHSLISDDKGEYTDKEDTELFGQYKLIQHDCLSGEKFSLKGN